jgi:hypothetical protein
MLVGLSGFTLMFRNRFTQEYDLKRVYFVSQRLRDKIYRENFDSLDYTSQSRAVAGLYTKYSQFIEPETRILEEGKEGETTSSMLSI